MTEEDIELVQGYIDSHWGVTGEARAAAAVLARLAAAEAQVSALRDLLSDVRCEDFYGECIYCRNDVRQEEHTTDCRYLEIDAASLAAPAEQP